MIKRTVIPKDNELHLIIPDSYVGREIEVFLYAKDELQDQVVSRKKVDVTKFKGILTKVEAKQYTDYLTKARTEWDSGI